MCREKLVHDYLEELKEWVIDDPSLIEKIDYYFIKDGLRFAADEYNCTENDITEDDIQRVLEKIYNWYENLQEYSNDSIEDYIKSELQDIGEDGEELNMIMDDFMMDL